MWLPDREEGEVNQEKRTSADPDTQPEAGDRQLKPPQLYLIGQIYNGHQIYIFIGPVLLKKII